MAAKQILKSPIQFLLRNPFPSNPTSSLARTIQNLVILRQNTRSSACEFSKLGFIGRGYDFEFNHRQLFSLDANLRIEAKGKKSWGDDDDDDDDSDDDDDLDSFDVSDDDDSRLMKWKE